MTPRTSAEEVSAATAMRATAAVETAATVKSAAVGCMTAAVSAADVEMATAMRPAAVGATVTSSAVLSERRAGSESEGDGHDGCEHETYGREFRHFIFPRRKSEYLVCGSKSVAEDRGSRLLK
jgi:hypothetical protein